MSSPNLLYNYAGRFLSKKRNQNKKPLYINENTQTSKTILQLADMELQDAMNMKKNSENLRCDEIGDHESRKLRFDRKNKIIEASSVEDDDETNSLYINKNFDDNDDSNVEFADWNEDLRREEEKQNVYISPKHWSRFCVREIRIKSYKIEPEARHSSSRDFAKNSSSSERNKDSEYEDGQDESRQSFATANTFDARRRAKSLSPPMTHRSSDEDIYSRTADTVEDDEEEDDDEEVEEEEEDEDEDDAPSTASTVNTNRSRDTFNLLLLEVKSSNWNTSLKAMVDIAELSEFVLYDHLYSIMPDLNQRLITFLRSPRSHVCRIACQIAGRFFETVKDTRRPEFDAIVDLLLLRTADANKFIRNDANVALDRLVIHIPPFHSIRAISQKAPLNKNDSVRITCSRLMVCIVGLAGADFFLSPPANEGSRKRLIQMLVKFILDKNAKTREYGTRLYGILYRHPHFEFHLKKIICKPSINEMRKIIRNVDFEG